MKAGQDYAILMIKTEQALRRAHDHCLLKQWGNAQAEVTQMIAHMFELELWLENQTDGENGKFEISG